MSCLNLAQLSMNNGVPKTPDEQVELGGNMQAGAGLLSAIGSLAAGQARAKGLQAEAAVERSSAALRATAIRRAGEREAGQARTAAAASGVSVGSASVLQAEYDIARYSEQDALAAILTGSNRAAGLAGKARQARAAGRDDSMDSLLEAGAAWRRTRRKTPYRADDPYRDPLYVGGAEGE